ncbi:MAG: dockerin type I domain-containing protein [Planctomycetota bacterium]
MPARRADGSPVDLPAVAFLTLEGDFNLDGVIDAADWNTFRSAFGFDAGALGAAVAYRTGDVNFDGRIDRFDFARFKDAFNAANGVGSFEAMLAGVPEPGSIVLLMIAGASLAGVRGRNDA